MKTLKRQLFLVLIFAFILSAIVPMTANAATVSDRPLSNRELHGFMQNPVPYINTPCTGGNGICQLYPKGWANTYDENGNLLPSLVNAWQCKNCYTMMITSGDPKAGTIIGSYVIKPYGYDLGNTSMHLVKVYASDIRYCGSNHLEGYQFQTDT